METFPTTLDSVRLIKPPTIFEDFRGHYVETYNERLYREAGIDQHFIQDDISVSRRHVLRGIHGDETVSSVGRQRRIGEVERGEIAFGHNQVGANAAVERVVAAVASQRVLVGFAHERIGVGAADQDVVAAAAFQRDRPIES